MFRRKEKNLVRVLNPGRLSEVKGLFRTFRGRRSKVSRWLHAVPGTPKVVAQLGGLVEVVLHPETARKRRLKLVRVLDHVDFVWPFNPHQAKLVADANGGMHVVGFHISLPDGLSCGRSYFLGEVISLTYKADKPHIEDGVQEYEHEFAEHGGERPRLFFKDGFLLFRGGTYSITSVGIDG